MQAQEVILCSASAQSSNAGIGSITIHDIQTGATLASFKQTNAGSRSVAVLESKSLQGGVVLAAQTDKTVLNVYNFQKDQLALKIILPEKPSCLTLDKTGNFCAAGTAQGRIYLWETASGILFNCWDAHYRQVNVLRFTVDGAALLSGGDDSAVSVWSVSRLVNNESQNELPTPFCTLSDHTLPVTDIVCGIGLFPNCRVLTSSVDHSVKVWDLASKSLLSTFEFPSPIDSLAWDLTERFFFATCNEKGSIYKIHLFRQKTRFSGQIVEAVGGSGANDVMRIENDIIEAQKKRLIQVGQPIASIALSFASNILLVGTTEGSILMYDVPSHQHLRTITANKGLSITYIRTMLKPPDLIGHVNLDFRVGSSVDLKDTIPIKPIVPFQRMKDAKAREAHEVLIMTKNRALKPIDYSTFYESDEFLKEHAFFVQPITSPNAPESSVASLQSRVQDLEAEVVRLKSQLGQAKGVNDAMWDTVVHRLVGQGKGDPQEKDQPSRKRGRIGT
ncbi:pre-rRNA-processing protein IPI3 [Coprinopsis cinerea okayama7|uniref:Pre-rRNA-processing protein IPI3 n=1 Tax=Coprinopsis cinerea (strain Okayama-7 / 130 / ATCC MYA-4618 / FGSC 9003) TaxID=240176 RepID=A8N9A4_COPC7|nr:pre-rRNA-processing protein IPI3 [Coprinopsis cinerea okayama7\|eukprot:XP_001831432.2 pre-rRNA-processing protein IPI3 [Coprinopsis cinerea okayama7\